jgi:hypothetical protein
MPAGSAVSLPLPQGPLSPSSFARHARFKLLPQPELPALSRARPVREAPEDPSRRRVLVAWSDPAPALHLQRLLRELGYRVVGPAGSRDEAERLIMPPLAGRPRVDCALVHVELPEAVDIANRLVDADVPLVWIVPDRGALLPAEHARAPVLDRPFDRAALAAAIEEARRRQAARHLYAVPPPQAIWPRVFPQL